MQRSSETQSAWPLGETHASRPTLADVAKLAKVSKKTASRVINNEQYVAEATRQKVIAAVQTLNYRPDYQAADLRRSSKRSRTIGMLIGSKANPFTTALHWAMDRIATDHSSLILASALTGDRDKDYAVANEMLNRRVDALILVTPTTNQAFLAPEIDRGLTVLFLDSPALGVQADSVMSDNYSGAADATRHLLEAGHQRIACLIANHKVFGVHERRRGFLDTINAAGIEQDSSLVLNDLDEQSSYATVLRLLDTDNPPTAFFAGQDLVARGAIRALHFLGLENDVALIGFDDLDMFDMLRPGITVISQDAEKIAKEAGKLLFDKLDQGSTQIHHRMIDTHLIARGSGEIPPKI